MTAIQDKFNAGLLNHTWTKLLIQRGLDTLELYVSTDAVKEKIGDKWIRISVNPLELSELCELYDASAPTPFILDKRFLAADDKNEPQPELYSGGVGMSTQAAVIEHSERVDRSLKYNDPHFIGNAGKHWVDPLELEELYGWHINSTSTHWKGIKLHKSIYGSSLKVIQPRSKAHTGGDPSKVEPTHEDYSMTAILVANECYLNDHKKDLRDLKRNPSAIALIWGSEAAPVSPSAAVSSGAELSRGSKGSRVSLVQNRLLALGFDLGRFGADGIFGAMTELAVKRFQELYGDMRMGKIKITGTVDDLTYYAIMSCNKIDFPPSTFPVCPFPTMSTAEKQKVFGEITFRMAGSKDDPERVIVTNSFLSKHVSRYSVPELDSPSIVGAPKGGLVFINDRAAPQILAFFREAGELGLMQYVLSWEGLGNTRLKRGYREPVADSLSSHAWFSAFDINAAWNHLGAEPAVEGERGSVAPLLELAYKHGLFWGGAFSRKDGMHFEIARVL